MYMSDENEDELGLAAAPVSGSGPWPTWRQRVANPNSSSFSSLMYIVHIPPRFYNQELRQGLPTAAIHKEIA